MSVQAPSMAAVTATWRRGDRGPVAHKPDIFTPCPFTEKVVCVT